MKFLIIEDDDYKKNKIVDYIVDIFGDVTFKSAKSVNSAVLLLENLADDYIVLLDMSLPTYDIDNSSGGKPQGFGGKEILRNMEFLDLNNKVIVITQYESIPLGEEDIGSIQIKRELEEEFEDIFQDLIHFNVVSDAWKEKLVNSINEIVSK